MSDRSLPDWDVQRLRDRLSALGMTFDEAVTMLSAAPGSLDAALDEVVAALPEGGRMALRRNVDGTWFADAYWNDRGQVVASYDAPTPAAALRALAAKLRGEV